MAINKYSENEKTFYEVYVNGFDARGRRIQRRKRRIETLRKAETTEFELKRELAKLREEAVPYRWSEWFEECLKRMKLTQRPSTVIGYDKQLRKWISPRWNSLDLTKITKMEVHTTIYEGLDASLSPFTRKTILKMVGHSTGAAGAGKDSLKRFTLQKGGYFCVKQTIRQIQKSQHFHRVNFKQNPFCSGQGRHGG